MKRFKKISYPDIDGSPEEGETYMTKNARIDDETLLSKDQMKKEFQSRFGSQPAECFYGKPNGSLLYAGPVPTNNPALSIQEEEQFITIPAPPPPHLQSKQLSFLPEKETKHGNHYTCS